MNFLNIALTIHDSRCFISIELLFLNNARRRLGVPGSGACDFAIVNAALASRFLGSTLEVFI